MARKRMSLKDYSEEERRDRKNALRRLRREHPEQKLKEREYRREYNQRPEVKEREAAKRDQRREWFREWQRRYRTLPGTKERRAEQERRYAQKPQTKERIRARSRFYDLKKYGLTQQDWERMFQDQAGLCAICKERPATDIDHDRDTGQVRQLLCNAHNQGIGLFWHDPALLRAAAAYLERSSS